MIWEEEDLEATKKMKDRCKFPPDCPDEIVVPELSDWECYLFGGTDEHGIAYRPTRNELPNRFIRWMMKICLGCTWVKKGAK